MFFNFFSLSLTLSPLGGKGSVVIGRLNVALLPSAGIHAAFLGQWGCGDRKLDVKRATSGLGEGIYIPRAVTRCAFV